MRLYGPYVNGNITDLTLVIRGILYMPALDLHSNEKFISNS